MGGRKEGKKTNVYVLFRRRRAIQRLSKYTEMLTARPSRRESMICAVVVERGGLGTHSKRARIR